MASDFAKFVRTGNEKNKTKPKFSAKTHPRSKEVNVLRYRYRLPAQKEIPAWPLPLAAYGYRGTKARLAILKRECTIERVRMHKYSHKRSAHETESDAH